MKKQILFLMMVFIVFGIISVTNCMAAESGGILKIVAAGGPRYPGYPSKASNWALVYDSPALQHLLRIDKQGQPHPELATSWAFSPDRKTLTFKLRKGVTFHDGTEFNAEAVKFNYDLCLGTRGEFGMVTSIDVIDNFTVRFNLSQYKNTIFSGLCNPAGFIVSPTAIKTKGEDWAKKNPVGTGPFKLVSFKRNVHMKFERFDGYWGQKAYLDGIEFSIIKDPMTLNATFRSGDAHVLFGINVPTNILVGLRDKGYKMINEPERIYALVPDSVHPDSIYANKKVRKAIEYAIDREGIAKAVGQGFWQPLTLPSVPGKMGFDANLTPRSYNPEKSKQLLKEAGYPDGFSTRIIARNRGIVNAIVAIQKNLADVGIKVNIDPVDMGKWVDLRMKGWSNALLDNIISIRTNFASGLEASIGPDNPKHPSLLKTPEFGDLMRKTLAASELPIHEARTKELVKYIHEEAMILPLFTADNVAVLNDSVNDAGFFTFAWWSEWSPEKCWLSRK